MKQAPHKVALVDDDVAVREALAFALELENLRVSPFESAEALLASSSITDADCLIIDYRLPGMDGISLMTRLRAQKVLMPAILITSSPSRGVTWAAQDLDASIVEKPLLDDELIRTINMLLRRRRSG